MSGVLSSQTLNLLAKNTKSQIESNDNFILSSKAETDVLVSKAREQISKYFDDIFAMDLPINTVIKIDFNNNDGNGDYRIGIYHENDKKLAYFNANYTSDILISNTHIINGKSIDYTDEDADGNEKWHYGFVDEMNHIYDEKACKAIMQNFDTIQSKFNLKILNYLSDIYSKSEREAKSRQKTLSILKENVKEDE